MNFWPFKKDKAAPEFRKLSWKQRKLIIGLMMDLSLSDGEFARSEMDQILRVGHFLGFSKSETLSICEAAYNDLISGGFTRSVRVAKAARKLPKKDTSILIALITAVTADNNVTQEEENLIHCFGEFLGFDSEEVHECLRVAVEQMVMDISKSN